MARRLHLKRVFPYDRYWRTVAHEVIRGMIILIVAALGVNLLCLVEAVLFHITANSDSMQQSYLWAAYTVTTGTL